MGVITWRPQLSVGQPSIDADHKHLIVYLNELDAAISAPVFSAPKAGIILIRLLEYTQEHFAREERLMQQVGYPKFEEHARQHRDAVRALTELSNAFSCEPGLPAVKKLYSFTANWLVHHIIMQDTQLTPYIRGVWIRD